MSEQMNPNASWREGANYPSPVQKVMMFGYYDGPTDGVLQCGDGKVYRFELLAWNPHTQDLRVFGLFPMMPSTWEKLTELYGGHGFRWQERLRQPIEEIVQQAGPVEWVVATEDLQGEILQARAIRPEELDGIPDWSKYFGLTQELCDSGPYLKVDE